MNEFMYLYVLSGPSYAIDTACSSSLLALDQALYAIRAGHCDAAIVGGSNLCLKPATTLQFQKLSMLSPHGTCKSFDASGQCPACCHGYLCVPYLVENSQGHAKKTSNYFDSF